MRAPVATARAPRVGIVVLHWNGLPVTRRCLESLRAQTYSTVNLYVIDNGSTDDSLTRLMEEFGAEAIVFLENHENLGFSAGNNPAIRRALDDGCEYVMLLNNDVVCHSPRFLEHGVAGALRDPAIGIVGGKLVGWPDVTRLWSVGGEIGWMSERFLGLGELDRGQYDTAADRSFISGAMMLVHRDVFASIGLLPEEYFFGGEDREFSLRARRAGFRLRYEPRFLAAHEAGASHAAVRPEYVYNDALSRILFRRRNQSPWSHALWRAAYRFYLECLFPLRHALQRGRFLGGITAGELRDVLRDAWRDSRGLERTTAGMIAAYRERRERAVR
ncbi:MAG: glycosyltransferase family 2 protein [Candidatus Eisenbacteria bacterium]